MGSACRPPVADREATDHPGAAALAHVGSAVRRVERCQRVRWWSRQDYALPGGVASAEGLSERGRSSRAECHAADQVGHARILSRTHMPRACHETLDHVPAVVILTAAMASGSEASWSSTTQAAASAVTACVAIAAAVAAYFKFVRGRTFQPRLTLAVTGEITEIHGVSALVVEVDVKNDGQSGVVLDPCYSQSLDIFILDEPVWDDAFRLSMALYYGSTG